MLTDKLRDGAHGKVFKILFWIIILSFIFAGVGNYLIPRLNTDPVKIGNYSIKSEQWNAQYQDQVRMMQNQYGPQVNKFFENPENVKALRMQVLERMIDNVALNSVTYEQGIRVGDDQVKDAIRKERAFQKDGKFSNDLFLAQVRNMGSSPDYFAEQLRTQLAQETLVNPILLSGSSVYPHEVELLAKLFAQTRVIDTYTVDTAKLAKTVTVTDDEVKKFYEDNKKIFKKPASVKFTYILLSLNDLKKEVEVTDEKLEEYYNLNQTDFTVPQKRECSQILIKSSTENFAQKAKEALAELKSGKSFEEVGLKYSDDKDFEKDHGSLGLLEKGSLSSQLDIALFAISKVGDVSEVVTDESGAHILKLDGITEAFVPKLADIKDEVKAKFIDAKALELYNEKTAKLTDVSYENPDSLEAASKAVSSPVLESGIVSLGDKTLKWPLSTDEVQKLAFNEDNRTSNVNSAVISLGNEACIVLNVNEYKEESLLKFDEVKDKAAQLTLNKQVSDKAASILDNIKKSTASGKTVDSAENVTKSTDVTVSRDDRELDPYFVLEVYSIPNKENASVTTTNKGQPVLAVIKSVNEADKADFDKYTSLIRSQLVHFKQNKTNSMIYLGARDISDIEYNEEGIKLVNQQNNGAD